MTESRWVTVACEATGQTYDGEVIELASNGRRRVRWFEPTMQHVRWFSTRGHELRQRYDSLNRYTPGNYSVALTPAEAPATPPPADHR